MTRRVAFSSGHRYWLASRSQAENRAIFGPWASPYNHGHNYGLDVTVEGSVNPETGMIVNIKRVDDVLKARILAELDQRSINDEIDSFRETAPTVENLLAYLWGRLSEDALPAEARLVGLRLEETPLFYGETDGTMTTITRIYEFAASHRLHAPALTRDENHALYGKCNNLAGHGHNYVLEVTVRGEPDPLTGMICDLGALDRAVNEAVVDRYDHKNLNEDLPEFRGKITTSEVVAEEIFRTLAPVVPARLCRVRLHETARNIFEVCA